MRDIAVYHQKHRTKTSAHQAERGQSLVEFAFTAMILVILLSGIVDLGRLYYIFVALEDAAGEAALFLSVAPACPTEAHGLAGECDHPNNAEWRARNASGGALLDWTETYIITDVPDVPVIGDTVEVSIQYDFDALTPFVTQLLENRPLRLTAIAAQIIVSEGQFD